jgi:UDP-N-acetylglucosamine--N-acetylmuramyl-(pentapeptide) pyrophosphoryl-undecaprenol N-acetylglucosamine transferase
MEPNVIVGTGGYASALPIKVGIGWKIPTVIQEQNSYPGLTTRLFAEPATAVYAGTSDTSTYLDTDIDVTGNPVRSEIHNGSKTVGSELFRLDSERKTVFLFGGSQGSVPLNRAIQPVLPTLQDRGIQLLWQTGINNYEALKELESDTIRIKPYIKEMAHAYALSDIAVVRAGALTLSELSVCGIPSILLPFPRATADHQTKNAETMVRAGAAIMIRQADLTASNLQETIIGLLDDTDKLTAMGAQALSLGKPKATKEIVDKIFKVALG